MSLYSEHICQLAQAACDYVQNVAYVDCTSNCMSNKGWVSAARVPPHSASGIMTLVTLLLCVALHGASFRCA